MRSGSEKVSKCLVSQSVKFLFFPIFPIFLPASYFLLLFQETPSFSFF